MLQLPSSIRIFLSSTYVDLHLIREEVAARLSEVFGAQLIAMESFGSDDTPPDITAIRRVAEADIFVGIYARRYGSIEPTTGKSITELELEEGERAFSAGTLSAVLLYVLDDASEWPLDDSDTSQVAREGLSRLKNRARRYTVTKFQRQQDLPFLVIRDVLAKLRDRLGSALLRVRRWELPPDEKLKKPIGMEFLRSSDRRHLLGRDQVVDQVFESLERAPITLLLGGSGVGKTSLIHAGVLPRAMGNNWVPVYTRPLGLPRSDVVSKLEATIFEGRALYRGPLLPLLGQIAGVLEGARLLLIIDQFEDVLIARDKSETLELVSDLHAIQQLSERTCRVLIGYRADLEGRLGHFWQTISGDPAGLPRIYLHGISSREAWRGVVDAARDLGISMSLTPEEETQIRSDLVTVSQGTGEAEVYPPYVQMLIDHMWRTQHGGAVSYRDIEYKAAHGMDGIIGGYLTRQLAYAQDREGYLKLVLIALVRSYGTKAQRTLAELAAETGLTPDRCEQLVEQLIDFRLVRHVDEYYEIAHDYLAREISTKLVDAEELEFKRFRELLASKAAAYATTGELLTRKERRCCCCSSTRREFSRPNSSFVYSWALGSEGMCRAYFGSLGAVLIRLEHGYGQKRAAGP